MTHMRIGLAIAAALVVAPRTMKAQASTGVERRDIPVTIDQENPCNGEMVYLGGFITVTTRTTVDAGGITHVAYNMVPHIEGSGASGAYRINGVSREHDTIEAGDGPRTMSYTETFLLIGQGNTPNYIATYRTQATIYPDGAFEPRWEHLGSKCVGK